MNPGPLARGSCFMNMKTTRYVNSLVQCSVLYSSHMTQILSRANVALPALAIAFILAAVTLFPWSASAAEATFDAKTLTTEKTKPTITGTAEDVAKVRVLIEDAKGKRVWRSSAVRVRDDEWKARVTKTLKNGTYEISILDGTSSKGKVLETGTLTIGKQATGGSLTASMLPLLVGGNARVNGSVPVAYVRIGNPGKTATSVQGLALTQRGTADVKGVASFTTSDDKGGSRATHTASFKNGSAYVPLEATIAPGQTRIFTIKADLASTIDFGKTLQLEVASVDTGAKLTNMFPLRGVTWSLVR